MNIRFSKKFQKQMAKLPEKLRKKAEETIALFIQNPHNPRLKNHPLQGKMKKLRAISVTPDTRIVFEEFENYTLVTCLKIGSHSEVYK